jgi:hypothetical protein
MRSALDVVRKLVDQALAELDLPGRTLTSVARKAIRIARLRGDYEALLWLQLEMEAISDKRARLRVQAEVAPHFTAPTLKFIWDRATSDSLSARAVAAVRAGQVELEGNVTALSIPELETAIANHLVNILRNPPVDRSASELHHNELKKVLTRLEQRVYTYLSGVERQLVFGDVRGDAFERNREYLEERLAAVAPDVLTQLKVALSRSEENSAESWSHALTSCRRALKSMADRLYPARTAPVKGLDGVERVLTDDKFIARLWQFIGEAAQHSASRKLLQSETEELGRRIDRLNELSSKGVHDQVDEFEVQQCVLSTYAVIGALVRLKTGESAAQKELPPDAQGGGV